MSQGQTSRFFGAMLIIAGTSIGAGLLGLPVATSAYGGLTTLALLVAAWLVMTTAAFLIYEVSMWLPEDSNMVSMAKATLGVPGQIFAWVIYLLLFYAILSAYTMAIGSVLGGTLGGFWPSENASTLVAAAFIVVIGLLLYAGTRFVDDFNRVLMVGLVIVFLAISFALVAHVDTELLTQSHSSKVLLALPIVMFSFGFQNVIPGLRTYLHSDGKRIRGAIIAGSLMILIIYIGWVLLVMGNIPFDGVSGLQAIAAAEGDSATNLAIALESNVGVTWIGTGFHYFTILAIATSFIGVAYALFDFLADGLNVQKTKSGRVGLAVLTVIPPFIIGLYFPGFLRMLAYAGVLATLLLVLLPALMVWRGRKLYPGHYQTPGGITTLVLTAMAGLVVLYTVI